MVSKCPKLHFNVSKLALRINNQLNLGNKQWLISDKFFTCPTSFEISGHDEVKGVYAASLEVYAKAVVYVREEPTPIFVYKEYEGSPHWIFSDKIGSPVSTTNNRLQRL